MRCRWWLLLLIGVMRWYSVEAACALDPGPCLNAVMFTFSICDFVAKEGECGLEQAKQLVIGTFDTVALTFTGEDGTVYPYTNDCGVFSIPTLGLYGNLNLDVGFQCDSIAIYGAVVYNNVEWGQFIGKAYIPPTPEPTFATCDFLGRSAALGCPELTDCHKGNWTLSMCNSTCTDDAVTECDTAAANMTYNATLNWGKGLLWTDGAYYEYKMDCRRW
jgi:hypothetical protein